MRKEQQVAGRADSLPLYLVGWYQDLFDIAEIYKFEYEKCRGEIRRAEKGPAHLQ